MARAFEICEVAELDQDEGFLTAQELLDDLDESYSTAYAEGMSTEAALSRALESWPVSSGRYLRPALWLRFLRGMRYRGMRYVAIILGASFVELAKMYITVSWEPYSHSQVGSIFFILQPLLGIFIIVLLALTRGERLNGGWYLSRLLVVSTCVFYAPVIRSSWIVLSASWSYISTHGLGGMLLWLVFPVGALVLPFIGAIALLAEALSFPELSVRSRGERVLRLLRR